MNIEPKHGPESQAYSAAHLAGSTHRKLRHKKLSSTKGEAKGRSKRVSYCPECPIMDMGHPETHVKVTNPRKRATCRFGHKWDVR